MSNDAFPPEPPVGDEASTTDDVAFPVPPHPEGAVDDPDDLGVTVVAAPSSGIPVPAGAPPGYRGYGITSPPSGPEEWPIAREESPAGDPPAESAADAPAPGAEPARPDEPTEPDEPTDSATVAAPDDGTEPDLRDWVLRLPDGHSLLVDDMLLLGRNPDAAAGPDGARLVAVDDPARTVSRSHVVAGPAAHGELLLRNVSAVNALVVIGEDGGELKIQPGGSILLVEAARVLVGAYPITLERR